MAPTTFLSMLVGRALFFATLASFEDPFEGVPPPAVVEARPHAPPAGAKPRGHCAAARSKWKSMIERCRATACVAGTSATKI